MFFRQIPDFVKNVRKPVEILKFFSEIFEVDLIILEKYFYSNYFFVTLLALVFR